MKTVAIASQKGGTGKTTTAVHLATAATLAGYHAVVIDLDPQGSAATWGDDRGEAAPRKLIKRLFGDTMTKRPSLKALDRRLSCAGGDP